MPRAGRPRQKRERVIGGQACDGDAAVIPLVHEVKGRVPEIYGTPKPGVTPSPQVAAKVTFETIIGKIARPKHMHIVPGMPKIHSGKTMRRVLGSNSNTRDTGDITTLANSDVVEQIRKMVQGQAAVDMMEGPGDLKRFGEVRIVPRYGPAGRGSRRRGRARTPESFDPARPTARDWQSTARVRPQPYIGGKSK